MDALETTETLQMAWPAAWDHRAVIVPRGAPFEAIAGVLDKLGGEGWEYVAHLDGEAPLPETPPDLRGTEGGPVLLDRARNGAARTVPVLYLIFKRPRS